MEFKPPHGKSLFAFIFLTIGLAILYFSFLETERIEINHITIEGTPFSLYLKDKTLVHLSDLHIKNIENKEIQLLKKLESLSPDIILLTGDYVKWNGEYEHPLKFLSMLKANIRIWGVMGDYDYSNSRKSCLFCHNEGTGDKTTDHDIHFLKNSSECIDIDGKPFCVVGLDGKGGEDIDIQNIKLNNTPAIILSHNPLNYDLFDSSQEILMLSGDTHGGQIPVPSWLWDLLGYEKNAKYNYGFFSDGNKKMFVTKGVGTSHLPFRFLCRPEIVVYHF